MVTIDFFKLALKAAKIADDKNAINTIVLDVRDLTTMANYFVVTTAESTPQINAVSSNIEESFKYENSVIPVRREGISSSNWRIIDYGGLVIHIMSPNVRSSYNLESLWHKAKIININDEGKLSIPTAKKISEVKCKVKTKPTKKIKKLSRSLQRDAKRKVKKITKTKSAKKIVKNTSNI
ncbi:MAG: ribosome silencing factor [Clostridiales Family XIII bacterium]|jgi:ribosome-associated protein|nr:ribosome silencing factor [Clostridiales Family XIII bacterium]